MRQTADAALRAPLLKIQRIIVHTHLPTPSHHYLFYFLFFFSFLLTIRQVRREEQA
jgi:hypothetical protein